MDLYANFISRDEFIEKYLYKNYGQIPRLRGVRFMKIEKTWEDNNEIQNEVDVHNKYVGTDTIYIHTRCGNCGLSYKNKNSNYLTFGAKDWEKNNKKLFLEHITDGFDCTYCTHYFKAVINDDYKAIIKILEQRGK